MRAGLVALQLCGVLNLACLQVGLIGLEAHHVPIAVPGCLSLAMWLYYVMLAGPSANVHPTCVVFVVLFGHSCSWLLACVGASVYHFLLFL